MCGQPSLSSHGICAVANSVLCWSCQLLHRPERTGRSTNIPLPLYVCQHLLCVMSSLLHILCGQGQLSICKPQPNSAALLLLSSLHYSHSHTTLPLLYIAVLPILQSFPYSNTACMSPLHYYYVSHITALPTILSSLQVFCGIICGIVIDAILLVAVMLAMWAWWIADAVIFGTNQRLAGDGCPLRPDL